MEKNNQNIQIQVFKIRMSKNHFDTDIKKMNRFLKRHSILKSYTNFVCEKFEYWTLAFHYKSD